MFVQNYKENALKLNGQKSLSLLRS